MLELGTISSSIEDKYIESKSFKRKNVLSQEEAYFWFSYDWNSGCLKHRWAYYLRKDNVGWLSNDSYKFVLLGTIYSVTTTIWTLFFGEVPDDFVVDYKDGDSSNTRIENLFIRHYSFIVRKKTNKELYRFEKSYTGVSFIENEQGLTGWQAKFKGHSSFGNVSKTGPLRDNIEDARQDYVKFKTEYMRGLFVYPLWNPSEQIYLNQDKFLDEDMVDYFNSLPVHKYQIKFCYKDPYLSNKILPDIYSIGDCRNTDHPVIQKYFEKYNTLFKSRLSYLKAKEKKRLKELLVATQTMHKLPLTRRLSFDKVVSLLSYYKVSGLTKNWSESDKLLLDNALQAHFLLTSRLEDK